MHSNTTTITNRNGATFGVNIIRKGDAYGLDNCLRWDEDEPLVEFYDAELPAYDTTALGRFVSRYYADDIVNRSATAPLSLDLSVPEWTVDPEAMAAARAFLAANI